MTAGFAPECSCETSTADYLVKPDELAPASMLDIEERLEQLCDFCAWQLTEFGYAVEKVA